METDSNTSLINVAIVDHHKVVLEGLELISLQRPVSPV